MKELTRENVKVYLKFIDGEYYGNEYEWETRAINSTFNDWGDCPSSNTKDARQYTIETINYHLDSLSEFIKPSTLLSFIKTISDPNTGEALYNNLQDNVLYVLNALNKVVYNINDEDSDALRDFVWGKHTQYGDDDECHLGLFGNNNNLSVWFKPHEEFVRYFKDTLKTKVNLYLLVYDEANLREEQIKYYKDAIARYEKEKQRIEATIAVNKVALAKLEEERK